MLTKIRRSLREEGPLRLLNRSAAFAYRKHLRRFTPTVERLTYNGVKVACQRKLLDRRLSSLYRPYPIEHVPDYEGALIRGLQAHAQPGDRVVVVGGGYGVTVVHAARQVGPSGHVLCYEGGKEYVGYVRWAAEHDGVADRVEVRHAVVARSIAVYGKEPPGAVVAPEELEPCDVLELDCEGAEVDILREMTIEPRAVLVETHGVYGAPTALVRELLEGRGYVVEDLGVAETWLREACEAQDIRVLAAVRPGV